MLHFSCMEENVKYRGRLWKKVKCACCSKEILRRPAHLHKNSFCSFECQRNYKRAGVICHCTFCNKELYKINAELKRSKTGNVFCNRSCATSYNNRFKSGSNHGGWKGGAQYRIRALKFYGSICSNSLCKPTLAKIQIPEQMLDVHHRDGGRTNNALENLEVLCVWCHAERTRQVSSEV